MQPIGNEELEMTAGRVNQREYWGGVGLVALGLAVSWIPGLQALSVPLVGGGLSTCYDSYWH